MSGRQPRLFAMNRYSVIQSEEGDEETRVAEAAAKKKQEDEEAAAQSGADLENRCCDRDGPMCNFVGCITKCCQQ